MTTNGLAYGRQQGRLCLWRYIGANRSYQGWHISADGTACQSLLALLNAFPGEPPAPYRTISLVAASPGLLAVPGRMFSGVESATKLRLVHGASSDEWLITATSTVVSLTFGESWRVKLCEAIRALSAGGGDFSIGPGDREHTVWFWWWRP